MKELKYNIQCLIHKKEFYISMLIIFFINFYHAFLCIKNTVRSNQFIEALYTGEYQFILYNTKVSVTSLIIIVFPIALTMIFSDSSWKDKKRKTTDMLFLRLNYKKNIVIRLIFIILVTLGVAFLGFMFNYAILRIVYGTGNRISFSYSELAFWLDSPCDLFLDNIRIANPTLFTILIALSVSFTMALLAGVAYLFSFFTKKKIVIYFIPILLLILSEIVLSRLGFDASLLTFLQPFSLYSVKDYIIGNGLLILFMVGLLYMILKKKDILL